jgi:D-glutamate N-acetyltransferase
VSQQYVLRLRAPYLVFLGDIQEGTYGKTGKGLVEWCPERVAGQIRLPGCAVDLGVPEMTVEDAAAAGVKSLIIGVALIGGQLPGHWVDVIKAAIGAGFDIVSGMHSKLSDTAGLLEAASHSGSRLIDVRTPPANIPVASGNKRPGKRVLMVGTDCAVGKKYSALALTNALTDLGVKATFRATGQTGIMLAGEGIAVDSVVADFISGAAELVSPANDEDHWDVIEGQGSLFNPGYAGVSLGLIHGSQPDALVMCHDATRREIDGWPGYPVPSLRECMQLNLQVARLTNEKVRFAGISFNTSGLPSAERAAYLSSAATEFGLPCVDSVATGSSAIAQNINDNF